MARQAKLGKKKVGKHTYWHTKAGGKDHYFGNVKTVTRKEADKQFLEHRQSLHDRKPRSRAASKMTCWEVCERYLVWSMSSLSPNSYPDKKCNLQKWCRHEVGDRSLSGHGSVLGDLPAVRITAQHLSEFMDKLKHTVAKQGRRKGKPLGPVALSGAMTHIKACWNWAAHPHKGNLFPADHKPFAGIVKNKIPPKPKSEHELPTDEEYEALLENADTDVGKVRSDKGQWRTRKRHELRTAKDNPYGGFSDIIRFYYATGPRTAELAALRVRDINVRTKQVTLGKHKRTQSQHNTTIRDIQLNPEALAIVRRQIKGKKPDDFVFTRANGTPWNRDRLDERFRHVRERAGVREDITIYSFRHLWISDMMEDPEIPVGTVAAMAGTSINQIQKTYGHFRNQAKAEAQARLDARRAQRKNGRRKKRTTK